jgi:hypothetical protein
MIAKSEQSEQSRKSAILTMGGIYDATGKLVKQMHLQATVMVHPLDVAELCAGIYTVRVVCNGSYAITTKLIKQ